MSFKCGIESLVFTIILMNQTLANVVCAGLNEERCPNYNHSSNVMVLMDSWEYQNLLLPNKGAVWTQFDKDMKKPVIKVVYTCNIYICPVTLKNYLHDNTQPCMHAIIQKVANIILNNHELLYSDLLCMFTTNNHFTTYTIITLLLLLLNLINIQHSSCCNNSCVMIITGNFFCHIYIAI